MEFEQKKVPAVTSFRQFASKLKSNPVSKQSVLVAKDGAYPYQSSEDAYVLLLSLAVKDMYMYVQPYVDSRTELTEYCIKISKIVDLAVSGNAQVHVFSSNACSSDDIRMNKGVRYVPFMADFFDPEKNKTLYKAMKNARMVCERKTKYDTDKPEYEDRSGYVELQHLRAQNEGNSHNYVQLRCVKAYKGVRAPASVYGFLEGEWKYVSRYLNYIVGYYNLCDYGRLGGIEKKRIETVRRDILDAVMKTIKKPDGNAAAGSAENRDVVDMPRLEEVGPSSAKKRKVTKKEKIPKTVKTANASVVLDNEQDVSDKENRSPTNAGVRAIENELLNSIKAIDVPSKKKDDEDDVEQENKNVDDSEDESDSAECDDDLAYSQYP